MMTEALLQPVSITLDLNAQVSLSLLGSSKLAHERFPLFKKQSRPLELHVEILHLLAVSRL